jgi:hypothetical protein
MAYTNKKSAKRKHRRRSKKGGVVTLVVNPVNSQATRKKKSPNKELDEAAVFQGVADDYTRRALDNALSIFSREQQRQAQAQAPPINVTIHSTSRVKRQGPTPGQLKKAEQKALAKQLKEEEKAQKKIKKEQEKAQKKIKKEEEQAAKEVTRAGVDQAFSRMFGEKYKASGPKLRKRS